MSNSKEIPLNVPDIGEAERIEIAGWIVRAGDRVHENQELCELITDKAAFPLECPHDGVIKEILRDTGDVVKVGETLALLEVQ